MKIISFFFLFSLIYIGFLGNHNESGFLKELRNFNLANLIVWSYWWPLIIVASVFFGRLWCMVCPIELITSFFAKIGLKKSRPQWVKKGWLITLLYIVILFIGINGFAIHRNPSIMAIYMVLLVVISALIGFWFKKNTFCKYACPIGFLLKLYSRFSMLVWGVKSLKECQSCTDKSCINKEYTYNLNTKSCGVEIYPAKNAESGDCILCSGCLKTCSTYKTKTNNNNNRPNPVLRWSNPLKRKHLLSPLNLAEILFTLVVSGFVVYEILIEWSVTKQLLMYFPNEANSFLALTNPIAKGLVKSIILFGIFPFILWLITYLLALLTDSKIKITTFFKQLGVAFLPIMAAAHICKALLKTTSRIPYFEHVLNDIGGMQNTQQFLDGDISLVKMAGIQPSLGGLMLTLLLLGLAVSVYSINKMNKQNNLKNSFVFYIVPILYGGVFIVQLLFWRFI